MSKNITSQVALFNGPNNKPVSMMFDQPASSSDAGAVLFSRIEKRHGLIAAVSAALHDSRDQVKVRHSLRSEEHTSELQSRGHLVCRLLLEKKKTIEHQSAIEYA